MTEDDLKRQIWQLIGATGYSLREIARLTLPQFSLLLEGIGPMLYTRLRPQLEANWSNVDVKEARKMLTAYRKVRAGEAPAPPSPEQRDRAEAYRIAHAYYLGELDALPESAAAPAEPLPIPRETAQAIVQAARDKLIPDDIWADLVPVWRRMLATAEGPHPTP